MSDRRMRPDDGELDDEIRSHLAVSIKERIDRGEDPVSCAARRAQGARLHARRPRRDAARLATPLVR